MGIETAGDRGGQHAYWAMRGHTEKRQGVVAVVSKYHNINHVQDACPITVSYRERHGLAAN